MSRPTYRFLFPMWEGGGTIPPHLGIARRLIDSGHQVHVLADPTVEDDAKAAGCTFSPWRRAPHRTSLDPSEDLLKDWEVSNPFAMLKRVRDAFVAGPAGDYAADTLAEIDSVKPDALVPDFMLFGTIIAAQAAELPVAAIVPNIWMLPTKGSPAIGPGFPPPKSVLGRTRNALMLGLANRVFNRGLPLLNQARQQYGLEPLSSFYDQVLDSTKILVLTSSTFDFASSTVPSNVRYLGPILDDPSWAEPWDDPWRDDDEPFLLVGFSSTFQDQAPLLRRIVEALDSMPVRAVVTLGQMLDADEVPSTDNIVVVPSAPHGPILERAAAVVTHCGHGTTLKALSAGVPVVCIPMGRDQNDTAARVVHYGAGVRISPRSSVEEITQAVRQVLDDPSYRSAAQSLSAAIADEADRVDIVDEVISVIEHTSQATRTKTATTKE